MLGYNMFCSTIVLVRFDSVWFGFADVNVGLGLGDYSWRGKAMLRAW